MSSEVQPKCTSSSAATLGPGGGQLIAHEILDRLDVVVDALLDRLDRPRRLRARDRAPARRARSSTAAGEFARRAAAAAGVPSCSNHSASTRMRSRISAASEKYSRSGAAASGVAPIHGRERGQGGGFHGDAAYHRNARLAMITHWLHRAGATPIMSSASFRIERDSMGELKVPADALWGAQTQRAVENFPISGLRLPRGFIRALALIKQAAAAANARLGLLEPRIGQRHRSRCGRGRGRRTRRAVSDRRVPDRLGHQQQHECQRGDRAPGGASGRRRCTPTITSTWARAATM